MTKGTLKYRLELRRFDQKPVLQTFANIYRIWSNYMPAVWLKALNCSCIVHYKYLIYASNTIDNLKWKLFFSLQFAWIVYAFYVHLQHFKNVAFLIVCILQPMRMLQWHRPFDIIEMKWIQNIYIKIMLIVIWTRFVDFYYMSHAFHIELVIAEALSVIILCINILLLHANDSRQRISFHSRKYFETRILLFFFAG